ncbi:MAG: tRNA (adenosine(37)-N6)-threonylcarbamoyltransferase complex dimerization subunit type 1 TsaB [Hyphomicrobiaceae bacterium]
MTLPRNILAIDTTFAACSAALRVASEGGCHAAQTIERFEAMTTGHAERLVAMIADVLQEAAFEFDALDALAVTVGPGTFTGTRIGVAAARALALAGTLPVYASTSLAVMAAIAHRTAPDTMPDRKHGVIAACVDARRGQLYVQCFSDPALPAIGAAILTRADDVVAQLPSECPIVAVGSGAEAVRDAAARHGLTVMVGPVNLLPNASALFDVHLEEATQLRPLYLRPPDAKAQTGKSVRRREQ